MKKIFIFATAMICFMNMEFSALADDPVHQHAYSYIRKENLGSITVETHKHYVPEINDYATCTIYLDRVVYVYQCACGAIERKYEGNIRHDIH